MYLAHSGHRRQASLRPFQVRWAGLAKPVPLICLRETVLSCCSARALLVCDKIPSSCCLHEVLVPQKVTPRAWWTDMAAAGCSIGCLCEGPAHAP